MISQFSRTEMLIGSQALEKLSRSVVAVFGIGGALCSLLGFFKVISIESKRKSNKQPGAFNK